MTFSVSILAVCVYKEVKLTEAHEIFDISRSWIKVVPRLAVNAFIEVVEILKIHALFVYSVFNETVVALKLTTFKIPILALCV
jgi:hypothetical protein